ncbi:MAPEG family protein [Methyloligella sp. 2.7D]|uniref:MAPEG family protein n=1 Tax=unclassified Methyloligella TaxID=2625955 RepID=UPI00157DDB7D|nr:MAPEG family protein [Methyloligella sp. GL2]QKP77065.1 MAPEG family protein [Methyloligella sp. GL2]
MPIPILVLLLYVLWTIAVMVFGLGLARLRRVRRGETFSDFPGGVAEGPAFHQRAVRAHLNCAENLPLYAAVALSAAVLGIEGPVLSGLAILIIVCRIAQSSIHLALPQTEPVVRIRGSLFGLQTLSIGIMAIIVICNGGSA